MTSRSQCAVAFRFLVILSAVAGAASCGWAQDAQSSDTNPASPAIPETPPPSSGVRYSISADTEWLFDSDIDNDRGSVSVGRFAVKPGVSLPVLQRSLLNIGVEYELSDYEFDRDDNTGASLLTFAADEDLFDSFQQYGVRGTLINPIDERRSWFVGGGVEYTGELGADFGDSLTYAAFGGLRYAVSESFQVGFAVGFVTRLEDDAFPIPVPQIQWQINDRWKLDVGSNGPRADLWYKASESLNLGASVGWLRREWRLDDDGVAPEGVFRDSAVPVMFNIEWTPHRQIAVDAGVGATVSRTLTVFDGEGLEVAEEDTELSPVARLGLTYRF
jgi:hypothetical protein